MRRRPAPTSRQTAGRCGSGPTCSRPAPAGMEVGVGFPATAVGRARRVRRRPVAGAGEKPSRRCDRRGAPVVPASRWLLLAAGTRCGKAKAAPCCTVGAARPAGRRVRVAPSRTCSAGRPAACRRLCARRRRVFTVAGNPPARDRGGIPRRCAGRDHRRFTGQRGALPAGDRGTTPAPGTRPVALERNLERCGVRIPGRGAHMAGWYRRRAEPARRGAEARSQPGKEESADRGATRSTPTADSSSPPYVKPNSASTPHTATTCSKPC